MDHDGATHHSAFCFSPLLALLVLLGACSKHGEDSALPTPASAASAVVTPAGAAAPAAFTGPLSEAEFKKLHELTREKAPPLRGATVDIAGSRAYLSLPAGAKPPLPGVVVIHEWWGLNEHIMHWADRLAADGYAAIAPDLYHGRVATTPDDAMSAMKAVNDDEARATLVAAHAFLGKDPRIGATRTGSIGWCFGGKHSLELALDEPALDAVVVYYGHVTTDAKRLEALKAPLLGIFANKDQSIPPSMVDEFDAALTKDGKAHTVLRFDADHAFANPSGPRYDAPAAEKAWRAARDFLARQLLQP